MQEEQVSIGADVDVRQIMADVRAEVERKRAAGLYPPEVLDPFEGAGPGETSADSLSAAMMGLRQSAGFSTVVTTASQMGALAPLASSFKRVVRGSVRWYMTGILQQVELFAANTVHAVSLLADRVRRLEDAEASRTELIESIDARTEELKSTLASVQALVEQIDKRLGEQEAVRVRDRIPQLERSLRALRQAPPVPAAPAAAPIDRSDAAERSLDYFDFENQFRGDEKDIKERQRHYVELFAGCPGPVVDLGAGRGEFLELLSKENIPAYGVDRHPDMIERCKEKGLDCRESDALEHLASVSPSSLGGVFSAQMIEHLEIADVPRFFELAAEAIAPGGRLVVETLNPESLYIFAAAFYIDLGHLRPLHPLTLKFLAEKSGFRDVRAEYSVPPPAELRPEEVPVTGDENIDRAVEVVNQNFARFDRLVFGPQDYAIVATR